MYYANPQTDTSHWFSKKFARIITPDWGKMRQNRCPLTPTCSCAKAFLYNLVPLYGLDFDLFPKVSALPRNHWMIFQCGERARLREVE